MASDEAARASAEAPQPATPAAQAKPPVFAPESLLNLSAVNSGRFMVMRYDRASSIVWPAGFSPDAEVLRASKRVWVTAGGTCAALDGPLTALQLLDAVLKLEHHEPLDTTYAPDDADDWSEAQLYERCNDLAGETPWQKMGIPSMHSGSFCMITLMRLQMAAIVGLPPAQSCATCPRRGLCGLELYGRKKATGEPAYRPLWSGLFCGSCFLGSNLQAACIEQVCAPTSTFFTHARGKP